MTEEPRYLINRNEGRESVLHWEHGPETCNRDDMEGRSVIDHKTGKALQESGDIDLCSYCFPKED